MKRCFHSNASNERFVSDSTLRNNYTTFTINLPIKKSFSFGSWMRLRDYKPPLRLTVKISFCWEGVSINCYLASNGLNVLNMQGPSQAATMLAHATKLFLVTMRTVHASDLCSIDHPDFNTTKF